MASGIERRVSPGRAGSGRGRRTADRWNGRLPGRAVRAMSGMAAGPLRMALAVGARPCARTLRRRARWPSSRRLLRRVGWIADAADRRRRGRWRWPPSRRSPRKPPPRPPRSPRSGVGSLSALSACAAATKPSGKGVTVERLAGQPLDVAQVDALVGAAEGDRDARRRRRARCGRCGGHIARERRAGRS